MMTITPITTDTVTKLKAQLASNGATVTGDDLGTISGHGVTANYNFDVPSATLTVDVIHHPFYIPVSAIENQIKAAIDKTEQV